MDNNEKLDLRHIIMTKDYDSMQTCEDGPSSQQTESDFSTTSTYEYEGKQYFLDGKAKRRLRRAQERKLKKLKK